MFSSNPFALLTEFLSPGVMQVYVVLMILAVAFGTVLDLYHKRSAKFFALRRKQSNVAAQRRLGAGEIASLAMRTWLLRLQLPVSPATGREGFPIF